MRLRSIRGPNGPEAALITERGLVALGPVLGDGSDLPSSLEELIRRQRLDDLRARIAQAADAVADAPTLAPVPPSAPLLTRPPKLLGVGLNYEAHAGDLNERRPTEPATFMKPATTIIAAGERIPIPRQSERTTGEAELGLVIGRHCKDVAEVDAADVVAGVTTVIDMTAEDILQRNPRFLTRAKSFDGFLVLGPDLVTLDEIDDLDALEVTTLQDGVPARSNRVAEMMFSPFYLVAFFSAVMPLEPGDVISTGTPGAVVLKHGGTVGCRIPGVGEIVNPVIDLKSAP